MKKMLVAFCLIFYTFNVFADPIQVGNATDDLVQVRVGYGDGCAATMWVTMCIAPSSSGIAEGPGIPFVVRVMTNCPDADPTTESWTFNPWGGCAGFEDTIPYSILWSGGADGNSWGATII